MLMGCTWGQETKPQSEVRGLGGRGHSWPKSNPGSMSERVINEGKGGPQPRLWWMGNESPTGIPYHS